jgi:hypothetical protein
MSTLTVILGAFGVTAASLFADAKSVANSLVDQLKQEFQEAGIGDAATLEPDRGPLTAIRTEGEVRWIAAAHLGHPIQ